MSNFDKSFAYLLPDEGGYGNDPADHGGPTNFGITQADLAAWRGKPVSALDVKNMTVDEAKKIYAKRYWAPLNLDGVQDDAKGTVMFNIGVLFGISVSAIWAQSACNKLGQLISVDGHIGPKSLAALNSIDHRGFIEAMIGYDESRARAIVAHNPSQARFLHGWLNRAERFRKLI